MESTSALAAELQVNCEGMDEKQAMLTTLRTDREKADPKNRIKFDKQIAALTDELARLRANHQRLCHALQVLCSEPDAENQPPPNDADPQGSSNGDTLSTDLMTSAVRESISTAALVASSSKSINTAIVSGVAMVPAAAVFLTSIDDGVSEAVKAAALPALVGVGAIVARHFIA